ncbi:hypothetical protein [Gloeothece verrucosa]|uniref:Uncharacterized protein n=1 Tax=Gloeothece verrucosa (strain PCC 7822) TaxID=497965 RepID=E0U752_GLOV7|nr:hypothetical protein [Gloeothece verrucosa]ADN17208.1 conserved hypothetical protein [Gloeothece verrucosa PCC 7822]
MDKDTKFGLLAIGLPFIGLVYCGIILAVLIMYPWAREHPIIMATIFAIAPSLISGSIWLKSALKGQNKPQRVNPSSRT